MARTFNEDTRVKIPATLQFLRIGYNYQSMQDSDIDFETKIFVNRFRPAVEKINGRSFSDEEIEFLLTEIRTLIKSNDMGHAFYNRLISTTDDVKLVDWDDIQKNDFAVVDELPFTVEKGTEEGSFRPDINILINGMPLAFLEVKKPNNEGTIQAEFDRMLNRRLSNNAYRKFFNLIQFVSFSNNMEYENSDADAVELVKAGSFYTTPNGQQTSFSFFREDEKGYIEGYQYTSLSDDLCRKVIKDLGYNPAVFDTDEFQTANVTDSPCNRFITSMYDKERFLFILKYGILYIKGRIPEKHIMRYPQFFATRAIIKRLESGGKRGIIWHTQGSGKTELACYANRIIRDYYAKKNVVTRFFFVVDRLELLRQDNSEFSSRHFSVTNCTKKSGSGGFDEELARTMPVIKSDDIGEFVVVNIQKFEDAIPKARNEYDTNVQRIFFIDEAHRSYKMNGQYFKNLILCDRNAVFIALTGTPLLTKKERSNLKFGDYIHKYFYDKSIADGYTLRIKKEKIKSVVKKDIKEDLELQSDEIDFDSATVYESDAFVGSLCKYIEKDFKNFRITNGDQSIGGMVVCKSNEQAKKICQWFVENSRLSAGLVISDSDPKQDEINKNNQLDFKNEGHPDLLIVHYMLTTGYDVKRLKKMYLLRGPHAQNLLQTISRVNRPYKAPNGKIYKFGYITDFVDIDKEYDRTVDDYLKELEKDINNEDDDEEGHNSLSGLLVDVDNISRTYEQAKSEFEKIAPSEDLEQFSSNLTMFNKDTLHRIKRLLNTMQDCYVEFLLSQADELADKVDIDLIKRKIRSVQERIDFVNLKEQPVEMMDIISDKEIVEIFYEFLKTSVDIIDLSKYTDGDESGSYKKFTETMKKVQSEIKKNRNKDDIRIIHLNELLKQLFNNLDITDVSDLDSLSEKMKKILEEAEAINRENDRLAAIYDDNFAMVKSYQDAVAKRPDLDNKDIEQMMLAIYAEIKDVIGIDTLAIQGREGFIDETKKKVIKKLLKSGLYQKLQLKDWIDPLLSEMYTNLQNFN